MWSMSQRRHGPAPFPNEGATLVVPSLDRYGRSLANLITMVGDLRRREIGFTSLHENLNATTPGGRDRYLGLLACSRRSERDDLFRHVRHIDRP
jgi:DNA invertase Pin-like site-specific DNA recombinase